jgi:trimethylamine--corrinoid protein Co-methyltransferase
MSPEMLVIDNEIVEEALRIARGFEVNEDTLAVDVIRKVGPGGHFLAEKHTLKYLLKEHLIPKISDRKTFEAWKEAGGKDIVKVAKEKVHEILATHKPETIPKDVQKDIAEIFTRYKKECSQGKQTIFSHDFFDTIL